jgi:hypothetical protein
VRAHRAQRRDVFGVEPGEERANGDRIGGAGVRVANVGGEEIHKPQARVFAGVGDQPPLPIARFESQLCADRTGLDPKGTFKQVLRCPLGQFFQQCLCLLKDRRVVAFGEPAMDRGEKVVRLRALSLRGP